MYHPKISRGEMHNKFYIPIILPFKQSSRLLATIYADLHFNNTKTICIAIVGFFFSIDATRVRWVLSSLDAAIVIFANEEGFICSRK